MSEPLPAARRYLLDNSAFARSEHPAVASSLRQAVAEGKLVACGPFVAEALYSARHETQLRELREELTEAMPSIEIDEGVWRLARNAQLALATVAPQFHRRPPTDYLIAAAAHAHRLGILHYDRDYDVIAKHGGLEFESRWIAEGGSLAVAPRSELRALRRTINARLGQFLGPEARRVCDGVIAFLDGEIAAGGLQPLAPPQ